MRSGRLMPTPRRIFKLKRAEADRVELAVEVDPERTVRRAEGAIDTVTPEGEILGWAWYPNAPTAAVDVEILVDNEVVAAVPARSFRSDLQAAGVGDGCHGFGCILPWASIVDRRASYLLVRDRASLAPLGEPIFVKWNSIDPTEQRIRALERSVALLRSHLQTVQSLNSEEKLKSDKNDNKTLGMYKSAVAFPSATVRSLADFKAFEDANAELLAHRYVFERQLLTSDSLILSGTCAVCRRPTRFSANRSDDGDGFPNWRETLISECCGQSNRNRATLHFLESVAGMRPWIRAVIIGELNLSGWLRDRLRQVKSIPRLVPIQKGRSWSQRLPVKDSSADIVLCPEVLSRMPFLEMALSEVHRILNPGGRFVFTVPFHFRLGSSEIGVVRPNQKNTQQRVSISTSECHKFGWDVLQIIRSSGFSDIELHIYWSEELGYLGPFNFLFMATK